MLYYVILVFKRLGVVCFLFKEMYTFIQQECMQLIKSDSKDFYMVTNEYYFK